VEVASQLSRRGRSHARRPDRSDPGDALAIAGTAAEPDLPLVRLADRSRDLQLLAQAREAAVETQTRRNRLHAHLGRAGSARRGATDDRAGDPGARADERPLLMPLTGRLAERMEGGDTLVPLPAPTGRHQVPAAAGETVEVRPLAVERRARPMRATAIRPNASASEGITKTSHAEKGSEYWESLPTQPNSVTW
jgi:hypothetical protein